ncbi:hypothetical protein RclHR1_29530003 [Rhizophagus clarus]|uniref:Uncharacterized protein n=1 Tax=Rhizophagus clarus TaxID=94130 RepID=A0A2Z6RJ35_9GLOM|nr:hypothetical protein RclHR1_29530003 [Rhizophagus clarus]
MIQYHVNNLFLMANSSTPFSQRLFVYRLILIQFRFLIPISLLKVDDWSLWSNMNTFKCDYIACTIASIVSTLFYMQHAVFTSTFPDLTLPGYTLLYSCMSPKVFKACLKVLRKCHLYYLSQLITPTGSHLISWTAYQISYIAHLADKRGHSLPHKWYLDIKANTTLPDSHDHLYDHYACSPSIVSAVNLVPGITTTQKNRHWFVSLDGNDAPLFGKQLSVQPKKDTYIIVHWISDCLSSSGDVIRLALCADLAMGVLNDIILACGEVVSSYSWADFSDTVVPYYRRLDISPDFSSFFSIDDGDLILPSPLCDSFNLSSPVILPSGSHYRFYTDGSLIKLGSSEVSMGWSWVQIVQDAGYLNSVAIYAHGTIRNWPSFTRAEAATIYAALSVSPDDSTISIYTDFQAAIDGLHLCASSSYTNNLFPVKVKGHSSNYWNEFADSLANSAHHSNDTIPLSVADYTSSHNVHLVYDDIICKSNSKCLLKIYYQATFMKEFLSLKRFQFTFYLCNRDDYMVDWELTWFTLDFSSIYDASFRAQHASRHHTFKFKLFLDKLPPPGKIKNYLF